MRATRLLLAAIAIAATAGCTHPPDVTGPDPNGAVPAPRPADPSYGLGGSGSGAWDTSPDSTAIPSGDPQPTETESTETSERGLGFVGSGG